MVRSHDGHSLFALIRVFRGILCVPLALGGAARLSETGPRWLRLAQIAGARRYPTFKNRVRRPHFKQYLGG
jgi:hypothetical protein